MVNRYVRRCSFLGLLGAWTLLLGSPGDADAFILPGPPPPPPPVNTFNVTGIVANPVIVMPATDPWHYSIPMQFIPNTGLHEFFAPNPPFPNPATDYFTVTGFGPLIGVLSLSPLVDFSLVSAVKGSDTLIFDYTGTGNLSTNLDIGSILIDSTDDMPSITITYYDHNDGGPFVGVNFPPTTLVPEPSSIALLGLGLASGLYFRRRLAARRAA